MSSVLPGHEDLRERPVFDHLGRPLMVTVGNGSYYPLVMGPTGNLKAGSPIEGVSMADNRNYIVKDVEGTVRINGKPVAFSRERALELAGEKGEIEVVPDDMVVVLDDSARKLPRSSDVSAQVFSEGFRPQ